MDFLDNSPSAELMGKISLIAYFFDTYSTALKEQAKNAPDEMQEMGITLVGNIVLSHAAQVFNSVGDPDEITTEKCYDLLFLLNEQSVPFILQVEDTLSSMGVSSTNEEGSTPSQVLKELLNA